MLKLLAEELRRPDFWIPRTHIKYSHTNMPILSAVSRNEGLREGLELR